MRDTLRILGRTKALFQSDLIQFAGEVKSAISGASFLVIGGAGSIGQQVVREIFSRNPRRLHVVDISENNLVELVRDIRSTLGYIKGDFKTLPLDCGSLEFEAFLGAQERYDYVLNLSALKHVRSEKDPYTLMRMIRTNVLNTVNTLAYASEVKCRKYFAVSTDKAVNPANAMGATKRIMELCLLKASGAVPVSTARFANVAFSDGSLLHGFQQRLLKGQPLSAPRDVRRYFMTREEAGQLCLMSCILGGNRELFFPKNGKELELTDFVGIAERFLTSQGYQAEVCASEDEARGRIQELVPRKKWPCYFFSSDTEGEKEAEEFFGPKEVVDLKRFEDVGVIENPVPSSFSTVEHFLAEIQRCLKSGSWDKGDLAGLLLQAVPEFQHKATGRSLDDRM
jgi:FlaA1/EpsC-like NDP-sugar epimerase